MYGRGVRGLHTVCVLSTYANRLTRAPLDPQFEAFRWEPATPARTAARAT